MTIPNKDCLKTEAELPILWFFILLHLAQKISDTTENKIHTRYRYAISKSFITGTVRGTRDICPVIRKTLQPFTLQRRQPPDQFPVLNNTFIFADILIIDEALAVGDAYFTQKCMRFLRKFMDTKTVLFVSSATKWERSHFDLARLSAC